MGGVLFLACEWGCCFVLILVLLLWEGFCVGYLMSWVIFCGNRRRRMAAREMMARMVLGVASWEKGVFFTMF